MKIAEQLVKLRKAQNLSQDAVAEKLFVTRQTISKWEVGTSTPDLEQTVKLAELFEVGLDELVLGKATYEQANQEERPMNVWEFLAEHWWAVVIMLMVLVGWWPR
jgi:transcriptional regulator with XRE-family HTH domain